MLLASAVASADPVDDLDKACDNAPEAGIPRAECEDRVVEAWDAMAVLNAVERIRDGASVESVSAATGIPTAELQARWEEYAISISEGEE